MGSNTTGVRNVAVGGSALATNTGGSENVAIGGAALYSNTGNNNVAVGYKALFSNGTGDRNVAVGNYALETASSAQGNIAIGFQAMQRATTGDDNVAIGCDSPVSNGALEELTTGVQNTAVGNNSGTKITTAVGNSSYGFSSLNAVVTASYNSAFGAYAGRAVTNERGVYIGYDAGAGIASTAIGNIMVGMESRPAGTTGNYEIVIGYGTTGKGGQTGFINPVGGGVYQGNNSSSWSTTSDQRIKKNIVDNNDGLEKLMQVQVRNFEYRTEDEINGLPSHTAIDKQGVQLGVIAQEIQQVIPETVKEEDTGCLSVDPERLTWYLINAVKELSSTVETLTARIEELEGE
jgi:hypothetical protein